MLAQFKKHLNEIAGSGKENSFLLAVSGGIDSITMVDLFHTVGMKFGIAHCNFKLRDDESDQDEIFVQELASSLKVPFFGKSFQTTKYADENDISIQEAARDLRYQWLKSLRLKEDYTYICTAHHVNDSIETILLNLVRGTGIRGIAGIPSKNKRIIRPLNFASSYEIDRFAWQKGLKFRIDSSNKSDKYSRNVVRHKIIPLLSELNPALEDTFKNSLKLLNAGKEIYLEAVHNKIDLLFDKSEKPVRVNKSKLMEATGRRAILFEYIRKLGFNSVQNEQIMDAMNSESGKQFLSRTHRIILDRDEVIIHKIKPAKVNQFTIEEGVSTFATGDSVFYLKTIEGGQELLNGNKSEAFLDSATVVYPITLRKWKSGDSFQPLGLGGKSQKVSDYFINNKMSLYDKENTWMLESGEHICWIAGQRIGEQFKLRAETEQVLHITWHPTPG